MKLRSHVLASTCISGALFAVSRSWELALSSWVAGIFVDLDHIPDYLVEFGPRFSIQRFFHSFSAGSYKRIFILLHAWEWLAVLLALAWSTRWNPWLTGWLIGHSQHIILDQFGNRSGTFTYSLLFRALNRFIPRKCFPGYPLSAELQKTERV